MDEYGEETKMVKTTRLSGLVAIIVDVTNDPYYSLRGQFDERMNFRFEDFKLYKKYGTLTPWDWVMWPEICRLCEAKGMTVPVDPPLDIASTF